MSPAAPRVSCVVLSMGHRPAELARALHSVLDQAGVAVEAVVVGNGWEPVGLPSGVVAHALADNVGVPAARNVGAGLAHGDVLLFLDDDAWFDRSDVLVRAVSAFDADPMLAVVQPRSVDPTGAATAVRHVPRVGGRGVDRAGDVAWFWEGASFVRRTAFVAAGGWPGGFFYGHEGIELAWRVVDAGSRIRYDPSLTVCNPPAAAFRGEQHGRLDARNRVWVARRNLPGPLAVAYVAVWVTATLLRARSRRAAVAALRGFGEGMRSDPGPSRPIRWRTVWRLTRLGRPPVL